MQFIIVYLSNCLSTNLIKGVFLCTGTKKYILKEDMSPIKLKAAIAQQARYFRAQVSLTTAVSLILRVLRMRFRGSTCWFDAIYDLCLTFWLVLRCQTLTTFWSESWKQSENVTTFTHISIFAQFQRLEHPIQLLLIYNCVL